MAVRAGTAYELLGFIDDRAAPGQEVHGVPVRSGFAALEACPSPLSLYVAIGDLAVHRSLVERLRTLGCRLHFPNIIHPQASVDPDRVQLGIGNYVAAGSRVTAEVRIGDFNVVNLNSVLAHDVVLGSRCQVHPGAILNGEARLGDEVVIGAGAVLMPRLRVGARAVVGIGAVVGSDVPAGSTVVGNPARVIRRPEAGHP